MILEDLLYLGKSLTKLQSEINGTYIAVTIKAISSVYIFSSHKSMLQSQYKPEIDGLRAVAILVVVIYHFLPSHLTGGFIGVDIFFVISGFVISRLILLELQFGQFSYVAFYKKRIIRIFPALAVVMAFCLIVGWFTLFQDELYQLAKHVLSGVFFYSNFTLLNEVNYFDESANQKVLLNLWSLAIEEQFYIIWPILLVLLVRAGRYWLLVVTIVAICLSFLFNVWVINQLTEKAFYLPISRVWQLLVGALLAICEQKFSHIRLSDTSTILRSGVIGHFGLTLIALTAMLISPDKAYPGYWALLPTLASACIIYQLLAFPSTVNVLKQPVLVSIGKISYPLYLWHWPLLAFTHIFHLQNSYWLTATLCLSFLFAYLTYTFLEHPIRFVIKSSKRVFYLMLAMGLIATFSSILMLSEGASKRLANQYYFPFDEAQHETLVKTTCNKNLKFVNSQCVKNNPSDKADVVILGDSHAAALYIGFANNLKQQNLNLLHLGRIGCPYLPGVDWTKKNEASCAQYPDIKNAYRYILNNPEIKHVVLAMRWKNYANDTNGRFRSVKDPTLTGEKLLLKTLNKTIEILTKAGKKVYIVQTVPDVDVKQCIARPAIPKAHNCAINMQQYYSESAKTESVFKQVLPNYPTTTYYSTIKQICPDNKNCTILHEQKFLYKDSNHLSEYGAQVITKKLAEQVARAEHPQTILN